MAAGASLMQPASQEEQDSLKFHRSTQHLAGCIISAPDSSLSTCAEAHLPNARVQEARIPRAGLSERDRRTPVPRCHDMTFAIVF